MNISIDVDNLDENMKNILCFIHQEYNILATADKDSSEHKTALKLIASFEREFGAYFFSNFKLLKAMAKEAHEELASSNIIDFSDIMRAKNGRTKQN